MKLKEPYNKILREVEQNGTYTKAFRYADGVRIVANLRSNHRDKVAVSTHKESESTLVITATKK